ncbi:protein lifeguard 3-like isoform X1 [Scophthalmus maximus]|uniref:protein lifeguard 3-like isoform X1 n=1 Tax=Scophthalmus maximus TaxID=52904 RepID=UPI0015E087FE|nr:protein lifeguard 3-like isoform X1 [Scophthalmus maximus]XP_035507414.1 protein lifeguard 3-like isoform X1 [Scophthalmus maximus]
MSSKEDSPPPYEDAVHRPKNGNYPHQAQHGSPHPPPPSYSASPRMFPGPPGYWGQEGVYPQAGMWAAPGFSPSGMPTTIPTLSAGVLASNSGDMEDLLSAQWESTSVRHAFIRKVYLILTAQLAVTFSVVAVFTFVDPVRLFVIRYPCIYWASFVVYFLVYCILICCKGPRRRFPWNLVLLGVFTLALSYMSGTISSYYDTKAVFLAMGITALVCIAVTVFCFQTKVDFTSCGGLLSVAAVLLMIIGIVTAIVLSFQYVRTPVKAFEFVLSTCVSQSEEQRLGGVYLCSHSKAFLLSLHRSPGCICSMPQLEPSFTLCFWYTTRSY